MSQCLPVWPGGHRHMTCPSISWQVPAPQGSLAQVVGSATPRERLSIKNVAAWGTAQPLRPRGWGLRPQKPTRLVLGQHASEVSVPPEPQHLGAVGGSLTGEGLSVHRGRQGIPHKKQRKIISLWCPVPGLCQGEAITIVQRIHLHRVRVGRQGLKTGHSQNDAS